MVEDASSKLSRWKSTCCSCSSSHLQPSTALLILPTLLYTTAFSFLTAVNPKLIVDLVRIDAGADLSAQASNEDLARAAEWNLPFNLAVLLPALLVVSAFGSFSDHRGRRVALMLHTAVAFVGALVLTALVAGDVPVGDLIVGLFIFGCSGSVFALLTVTFAYAADVTTQEKKAKKFGWIEASVFVGHFLGLFIGDTLYDSGARWAPHLTATILLAICFIYFWFLPESLRTSRRSKSFAIRTANPLWKMFLLFESRQLLLLASIFAVGLSLLLIQGVLVFYATDRFEWSEATVTTFLAVSSLYRALAVLAFIPLVSKLVKAERWPTMTTIRWSLFALGVSMVLFALSPFDWSYYVISAGFAVGATFVVCARSILCVAVAPDMQGSILSAAATLEVLAHLVAPPIYEQIYDATLSRFPQLCFALAAACACIGAVMTRSLKQDAFVYKMPDDDQPPPVAAVQRAHTSGANDVAPEDLVLSTQSIPSDNNDDQRSRTPRYLENSKSHDHRRLSVAARTPSVGRAKTPVSGAGSPRCGSGDEAGSGGHRNGNSGTVVNHGRSGGSNTQTPSADDVTFTAAGADPDDNAMLSMLSAHGMADFSSNLVFDGETGIPQFDRLETIDLGSEVDPNEDPRHIFGFVQDLKPL